jgi:branched-chain amino acid aminotransferase
MSECLHDVFVFNNEIRSRQDFNESFLTAGRSFYEVLRLAGNCCLFLDDHIERLENSINLFGIGYKLNNGDIAEKISKFISSAGVSLGNIKIVLNFDEAGRKRPDIIIYFVKHRYPSDAQYRLGVNASLLAVERIIPNAKFINNAVIDAVNREFIGKNIYETLLVNNEGYITEGSKSNIFFIKEDTIYTPPLNKVLPGITRKYVFNICNKQNIKIIEQDISIDNLNNYTTVFLSGTSAKILPVKKINDFFFKVNNNILKRIMKSYNEEIIKYCKAGFL